MCDRAQSISFCGTCLACGVTPPPCCARSVLILPSSRGVPAQVIPVEASKLCLTNTFRAPVYVTQARRNAMGVGLVFDANLATQEHPSHWVLQGVALVLNIDR